MFISKKKLARLIEEEKSKVLDDQWRTRRLDDTENQTRENKNDIQNQGYRIKSLTQLVYDIRNVLTETQKKKLEELERQRKEESYRIG